MRPDSERYGSPVIPADGGTPGGYRSVIEMPMLPQFGQHCRPGVIPTASNELPNSELNPTEPGPAHHHSCNAPTGSRANSSARDCTPAHRDEDAAPLIRAALR